MKTKAAVQTVAEAPLEVVEMEVPDPAPGQVSVKLISSGICHSQLHQMENTTLPRPMVLGHEGTGVGRGISHVKEGDMPS